VRELAQCSDDDAGGLDPSTLDNESSRAFEDFDATLTPWSTLHDQRAQKVAARFLAGLGSSTAKPYAVDLASWLDHCRTVDAAPLHADSELIETFANQLLQDRGLAPSTVARRLSAISGFYRFANKAHLLPAGNPATDVRRPSVPTISEVLGLDRDELAALLGAAQRHSSRALLMVCLGGLNGLRVSEYLGADVTDQRTIRGQRALRVRRKGNKIMLVPLANVTAEALDAYVAGRTFGPLLLSRTGRRLDRSNAARLLRRVAAGVLPAETVAGLKPHSLRHSFVGIGLDAGVPIDRLQGAAAHASPVTTMAYDRARQQVSDDHPTHAVARFVIDGAG
jgi:integrase/recombinase XerD